MRTVILVGVAVAVVIALVVSQMFESSGPAAPRAVIEQVRTVGDEQHVDVEVSNVGGETAANVQVVLELVVDGQAKDADQTVDFLADGETAHLVFVVEAGAPESELEVAVTGYTAP